MINIKKNINLKMIININTNLFIDRTFFFLILKRYNHDINKIMNYMHGNKQIHKFIKLIHNKQKINQIIKKRKPSIID